MKKSPLIPGLAIVAGSLLATSTADAALVAHFPVNSATDSATFLNDVIDNAAHGVTDGTTTGSGSSAGGIAGSAIVANAFRGGDVVSTIEGHRYRAGTQDIDLNIGFSWSLWVNVNASNITDAGADSIIGTRNGSATGGSGNPWHKIDLTVTNNWHGATPGSGSYVTLADSTWHFLTYVGDTATRQLFKDGVLIATDNNLTVGHNNTFNGVMEIGGTSNFSEDITGFYDDIAIWNERLTADETLSLYEVSSPASLGGLLYDAGQFNLLKQIHDAGTGFVDIGDLRWSFASGLTGAAGLNGTGPTFNLVLNATADTGLISSSLLVSVPEPATASLALLGLGGLMMRRRRIA